MRFSKVMLKALPGWRKLPLGSQRTGVDACPTTQNQQLPGRVVGQASWPVWAFCRRGSRRARIAFAALLALCLLLPISALLSQTRALSVPEQLAARPHCSREWYY
jgi:hypothetical protein